jgi:hypothetical protein
MSEFKFACPVCGQRMAVDSSATGAQVECPTCFQIVIVPKAPAEGSKYQLSATQFIKPVILPPPPKPPVPTIKHQRKSAVLIFGLIFLCAIVTALFVREKIAGPQQEQAGADSTNAPSFTVSPLWTLDLTNATFPDQTAGGEIHGRDFVSRQAVLLNDFLALRSSTDRRSELGVNVYLLERDSHTNIAEFFSGRSIDVGTNYAGFEPRVSLSWHEGNLRVTEFFTNNFVMKLEFGTLSSNGLPGKIYLCLPDEMKSCVAGTFMAEIRNSRSRRRP